MKNRINVTIAQRDFTLVTDDSPEYAEKVAVFVSNQIADVVSSSGVSSVDGAILAAANIADAYFKEVEAGERLRRQVKEALDEAGQIKAELSEAKREIFRLSNARK